MSYGFTVTNADGQLEISGQYGDPPADLKVSVSGHEDATSTSASATRQDADGRSVVSSSAIRSA